MKVTNLCRKMTKEELIALNKWAKRLEAEEMLVHTDGSVTLECKDGYICCAYRPSASELRKYR